MVAEPGPHALEVDLGIARLTRHPLAFDARHHALFASRLDIRR
jgi:hypothetical protein